MLDLHKPYNVKELADALDSGRKSVYNAIAKGELKAAAINDRGDLRVLGRWAVEWLEKQAERA